MNEKQLTLKQNSMWNLIGSIIHALSQWLLLIVIAKLGNPELVGIFTLGLAITAPIVLLLRFHLKNAVSTDTLNEYTFNDYFTLRTMSTIVFIIIMLIVSMFYPVDFETSLIIFILSIAKSFESMSDIFHGLWQKHERLDLVAKSRIINAFLSLLFFSIALGLTGNLIVGIFTLMFTWMGVLLFYDYKITKKFISIKIDFNKKSQFKLFKLTIPLGLAQLIASLNSNIPRFFIEYYHGLELLGIFAAMFYIITAGINIIIAIEGAIIPRLSTWYQYNEIKKFFTLISALMLIIITSGLLVCLIIYNYSDLLLTIVYTEEYIGYGKEFSMLFVAGIFMYLNKVLETALTVTRKFIIQPYINGVILILTIFLSFVFIPRYAILGVAYTLIVVGVLQFFIRAIILYILIERKINRVK